MPEQPFRVPALAADTTTLFVDAPNDRVGIGTITPAVRLEVVGQHLARASAASDTPLTVRGAASQTADLQVWETSAGTDVAVMSKDGTLTATGGVVGLTTAGAPAVSLADGAFAVDTTNHVPYFRSGGTWRSISGGSGAPFADGSAAAPSINFSSNTDTGLFYDALGVHISTDGTSRVRVGLGGNLVPSTHAVTDLGANTARWKDGWFSGNVTASGAMQGTWTTGSAAGDIVMAANWTLTNIYWAKMGNLLQFRLTAVRANSAINFNTTGDIANTLVGTLVASLRGTYSIGLGCAHGVNGRLVSGMFTPSTGEIYLTAIGGTTNLGIGESVTLGGMFFLGN
jgi:hypothetical protein